MKYNLKQAKFHEENTSTLRNIFSAHPASLREISFQGKIYQLYSLKEIFIEKVNQPFNGTGFLLNSAFCN